MFYFIFIFISVYSIFTLWFAINSFKERHIRAGILGVVVLLAMVAFLEIYFWAKEAGGLSTGET